MNILLQPWIEFENVASSSDYTSESDSSSEDDGGREIDASQDVEDYIESQIEGDFEWASAYALYSAILKFV